MIQSVELQKSFHSSGSELKAVDGVSLKVNDGEVFGILGPNGAGKTTFFRLLSCLLKPTGGTAEVSGYDIIRDSMKVREKVGLLCEEPGLYDKQSVEANLELFGRLYGLDRARASRRVSALAATLEFKDLLARKAGTLSKGQRQKVSLARALLHEPDVLLLDEPTANLDPKTAEIVRATVKDLQKDRKRTVLVSSHNLDEVQRVCERVAVIDEGKILASGSIEDLSGKLWSRKVVTIGLKAGYNLQEPPWLGEVEKIPSVEAVTLILRRRNESQVDEASSTASPSQAYYAMELALSESATEDEAEDATSGAIKIISARTDLKVTTVERARHSLQEVYLKLLRARDEKDEGVDTTLKEVER